MSLNYSFAGKRVLVTGGGRGIGRQLVKRFYEEGAVVFTVDKNPETIKELKETLPNVNAEVVELGDWDATRKTVESFGVIDHLVNNAGLIRPSPFLKVTPETLSRQFGTNVFGIVNVSQVVANGLIEARKNGSIVNISSVGGKIGLPNASIYCATKAAIINLTKTMALELGQHNIRVNAVLPGLVDTPIHPKSPEVKQGIDELLRRNVNKRMIESNEIADLVMFLLSPLSTMIVGESVVIDGGLTIS